ncbi:MULTISPECIES: Gfo/Idh/MocA family protein [unclassified Rhizobium]|uniref:Gfo/Idh/MocA family protein n=1 Tax=unclassified Rhizobium TaxID=2613769 RepID=UPI001ADBED89|nr:MULTISPECIES: Gfo/Idh/MocA family oxidoreductase [unclassified Rhizobium]MBO9099176.1 Gfo/Idh/MocA family oxidoreductase [Rhizobium sp. L58/93]MBO9132018.1 Gfo/Idh/MocA family oxidoreductase [Rhizobium sp. B209b/85]MBO9169438.1 Gfo/Idh/MocA family oxidoreductase [Rhizobium sp. L245/93]MBO9185389.1 Gfo/Idh/MocA family oxidoreductase [Rhizobium sp. E27B/91]QXZ85527.1 Gfo/Idh/MocA family oxidoreductase [Rhizobium sp. K1/93]
MTFNAILCGCGAMSKGWLRAIASDPAVAAAIKIVGLVDLNRETAENLAKEFGLEGTVIGSDLGDVIARTKADMVFDVVIPAARFGVVSTALKAGCHVLSEKPMATSLAEGAALIELAAETGKVHAIIQNRRYIAGIRRLRRFVESGAIGELTGIHCDFFLGPHFGGFRDEMDHVLLLDMAIHTFDAARFVADRKPLAVYCVETNPKGSWYRDGASAHAIFEFSDDVTFTYRGSWCAEGRRTSWESQWRLTGSKGMLTWDGEDAFEATVAGNEEGLLHGFTPIEVPGPEHEAETHGHASVIASFLEAVKTGRPPETVSSDNIRSLAMVLGAIESARSGQRIDISA